MKRKARVNVHDVRCPRCLAEKYKPCVTLTGREALKSNGRVHRSRYRAAQEKMGLTPKGTSDGEWWMSSGTA